MIEFMKNLQNILTEDILKSLAEKGSYDYINEEECVKISANCKDNNFQLTIELIPAKKEAEKFTKFLDGLDDDLFIATCEALGNEQLRKIHECLSSKNLDTVLSGIYSFKSALKTELVNRINNYTQCLNSLDKSI